MSTPTRRALDTLRRDTRLDVLGDVLRRQGAALGRSPLGPLLRGEPLGHPLHPALTDLPIGCWTAAGLLDLTGGTASRSARRRLVAAGIVASVPTAAAGIVDLSSDDDRGDARVGAAHAALNGVALAVQVLSWRARRRGHHARGALLSAVALSGMLASAYLGGHLAFAAGEAPEDEGADGAATGGSGTVEGVAAPIPALWTVTEGS